MKREPDPMDFWAPVWAWTFLASIVIIAICQVIQTVNAPDRDVERRDRELFHIMRREQQRQGVEIDTTHRIVKDFEEHK